MGLPVGAWLGDALCDKAWLPVPVCDRLPVCACVGVPVALGDGVAIWLEVCVGVGATDGDADAVPV